MTRTTVIKTELERTREYRQDQINKLKNDFNYDPSIKLFGGVDGNTNQMDITKQEFYAICKILTKGF